MEASTSEHLHVNTNDLVSVYVTEEDTRTRLSSQ